MNRPMHRNSTIDMLIDSHADWQPWRETVGFVIRGITRRRFNVYHGSDSIIQHVDETFTVEFDILTGWNGQYVTTGIWSLDSQLRPLGEPICTPVRFRESISPQRIYTDLSPSEAEERLLSEIRLRYTDIA